MEVGVCYICFTNLTKPNDQVILGKLTDEPEQSSPSLDITFLQKHSNLSFLYTGLSNCSPSFLHHNQSQHAFLSMSIAILIAYNTCPVSNFHQGYFNLIQVITPIDISRLLHTGAAFQVRRLFSSDVASVQNCQWFDIPLTLVHINTVN